MARSRNIKPGVAENEVLAEMGPHAQFLFAVLPCHADREGRLEDRPLRIKAKVFPYYDVDVDDLLTKLAECSERFIVRYEVAGTRYIQITKFDIHQSPHHKEAESTIPPQPKQESSKSQASPKHDNVGSHAPVKGIRNQVKGISNEESVELERIENESLRESASGWLRYKIEKRQRYTPTGLKSCITSIQKNAEEHGPQAVMAAIQDAMGNGYQGIVWDKIGNRGSPKRPSVDFDEIAARSAELSEGNP